MNSIDESINPTLRSIAGARDPVPTGCYGNIRKEDTFCGFNHTGQSLCIHSHAHAKHTPELHWTCRIGRPLRVGIKQQKQTNQTRARRMSACPARFWRAPRVGEIFPMRLLPGRTHTHTPPVEPTHPHASPQRSITGKRGMAAATAGAAAAGPVWRLVLGEEGRLSRCVLDEMI